MMWQKELTSVRTGGFLFAEPGTNQFENWLISRLFAYAKLLCMTWGMAIDGGVIWRTNTTPYH